jgi:hypothetical protein
MRHKHTNQQYDARALPIFDHSFKSQSLEFHRSSVDVLEGCFAFPTVGELFILS